MKYNITLHTDIDPTKIKVNPIFPEIVVTSSKVQNQYAYLDSVDTKFTFLGVDYDFISAQPFDAEFTMTIKASATSYGVSGEYIGRFTKSKCTIDLNDKSINTSITLDNEFSKLMNLYEREYDISELLPRPVRVNIELRPLLQVYALGTNVIGNFFCGIYSEEEITSTEIPITDLIDKYKFKMSKLFMSITIAGASEGNGVYSGEVGFIEDGSFRHWQGSLISSNGGFLLEYGLQNNNEYIRVIKIADSVMVLEGSKQVSLPVSGQSTVTLSGRAGTVTTQLYRIFTAERTLCNLYALNGVASFDKPQDDIIATSNLFTRVCPTNLLTLQYSNNTTINVTRWGEVGKTKTFFLPPTGPLSDFGFRPILRNIWTGAEFGNVSIWLNYNSANSQIEGQKSTKITVRDAYEVTDVIERLIEKMNIGLRHNILSTFLIKYYIYNENGNYYSTPYFGTGILSTLITPNTNITKGNYDQAASRGKISLRGIMDMLYSIYRLKFDISYNQLRIEHESFYLNGYSHTGEAGVSMDITNMGVSGIGGKKWSDLESPYQYKIGQMPAQITFNWSGDCSTPFVGTPIEVLSNYREDGNIKSENSGNFIGDINFILKSPNEVSPDGFTLLVPTATSDFGLDVYNRQVKTDTGDIYMCNNDEISPFKFQPNFWLWSLPAKNVKINGVATTAKRVQRNKTNTVIVPHINTIDKTELIKTLGGYGEIEKYSLNLHNSIATITLIYDTEQLP